MKIIEPSAVIFEQELAGLSVCQRIDRCASVCYQRPPKPTEEEAEEFCRTVLEMDNDLISYIEIKTSRDYADAKDLMVAGLEDASHALMKERLSNMEVSGPMM